MQPRAVAWHAFRSALCLLRAFCIRSVRFVYRRGGRPNKCNLFLPRFLGATNAAIQPGEAGRAARGAARAETAATGLGNSRDKARQQAVAACRCLNDQGAVHSNFRGKIRSGANTVTRARKSGVAAAHRRWRGSRTRTGATRSGAPTSTIGAPCPSDHLLYAAPPPRASARRCPCFFFSRAGAMTGRPRLGVFIIAMVWAARRAARWQRAHPTPAHPDSAAAR